MRPAMVVLGLAMALTTTMSAQEDDMIYIPAGEFIMGTSREEAERLAKEYDVHPSLFMSECPRRKVNLPAFYIDRYPVTNAQYKKFIDATGHRPPAGWNGNNFPEGKGDYPVTNVNWNDAAAYAKWAGKRLPTEEEWEKAARGTDGRIYPWGNEWRDDACLIDDGKSPQFRPRLTPVGCFPAGASANGVMDMVGNVAEWTATPSAPPNKKKNWAWYVVKGAGNGHMMRFNFRCAARAFSAHQSRRHSWLGFRCAKDAPQRLPDRLPSLPVPPYVPKPIPRFAPASPPDESAYLREPITIASVGGHGASFRVPYFPEAVFSVNLPEQAGAAGYPFAWSMGQPRIKWTVSDDRKSAGYTVRWEGVAEMRVGLKCGLDYVDFTIAIKNLTDKTFRNVATNTCFNNSRAPYFEDPERTRTMVWTDDGAVRLLEMPVASSGEILHGGLRVAKPDEKAPKGGNLVRYPFIFVVSRDGKWVVAQGYDRATSVANNAHYTCLHSRPVWEDIPPNEERSRTGKLYFLKGGARELLERWKKDFGG